MQKPLVSVILTAYNDGEYVRHALTALTNQTLQDIEIVAVDDKSTDNTLEILQEFAEKDVRVKVVANATNVGLSVARNNGIGVSSAELIMFCDGDDYYEETMCEKMYEAITGSGADLAACEINVIYHAHQEMKMSDDNYYALKYSGLQQITDEMILKTDLSVADKIFRKSILQKYQLKFPAGLRFEDAYFCPAYFCVSKTIYFVEERLYNYVRRNNSIMSQTWSDNTTDKALDHTIVAIRLYEFLEEHDKLEGHASAYWQLFEAFLAFSITNGHSNHSRKAAREMASEFIARHNDYFQRATEDERRRILNLCSTKPHLNVTTVKKVLIKMMPTYSLQAQNIRQLRALKRRCATLIKNTNKHTENDD